MDLNEVFAIADDWWARDFACRSEDLRPQNTHVQVHRGAKSNNSGIWILSVGGKPMISIPPAALESLADVAPNWSTEQVFNSAALSKLLDAYCGQLFDRIVGPAYIGYGSEETLDLRDANRAKKLGWRDREAIVRLMQACTKEEWEHGGSDAEAIDRLFGVYTTSGDLAALAGYELWGDKIAHIAIATHPAHRGLGFGRAAVALSAQAAMDAGLVPQYRTLYSNIASMGIAARLGFVEYGRSVYVRPNPHHATWSTTVPSALIF